MKRIIIYLRKTYIPKQKLTITMRRKEK